MADTTTPFYPVEERETYLKSIICLIQTLVTGHLKTLWYDYLVIRSRRVQIIFLFNLDQVLSKIIMDCVFMRPLERNTYSNVEKLSLGEVVSKFKDEYKVEVKKRK